MGGLGNNSCLQQPSSNECALADVPMQLLDGDTNPIELNELFPLIPDGVWVEIDGIIKGNTAKTKRQLSKLVRIRESRAKTPFNYTYGLDRKAVKNDEPRFLKPKMYQCQYCTADMLNVHVYLRHLRHHREAELRSEMSRCNSCGWLFNNDIETKWHQTHLHKRAIVSNL